jgi:hypothetical protein
MTGQTITCPTCHTSFALDESLAAPLIAATRKEFEAKLSAKDDSWQLAASSMTGRRSYRTCP